ncbi:MAG: hypothetical protein GKR89_09360 [Candidatus Latescibacteria bacterium]|nr:hypothetical protein [Candidatus Latescibacterota bacterium]
MNKSARSVLRRLGQDQPLENQREELVNREIEDANSSKQQGQDQQDDANSFENVPEDLLTESEKRHGQYRRRQAMAGRVTPAAERLPIMTSEQREAHNKDRPKWRATEFEGPIEKLIEKYQDLEEVQRHLTLGQSMKYEFTADGRVLDKNGNLIYDGEKLV